MNTLIYTLAYGDEFWECAGHMVRSLRTYGEYGGDIIVFADRDGKIEDARVSRDTAPLGIRHIFMAKAMLGRGLPTHYDRILYLDSDIVVLNSIWPLLEYPHPFSMPPECINNIDKNEQWFFMPEAPRKPGEIGYNAGTIGCSGKLFPELCHTWWDYMLSHRSWEIPGGIDQQPINYLARSGQLPFEPFPKEWFFFFGNTVDYRPLHQDTIIFHPKHEKPATMKMALNMRALWE
jgi:hypothetical protein